jgi:hypothetical protein
MNLLVRHTHSGKYAEVVVRVGNTDVNLGLVNKNEAAELINALQDAIDKLKRIDQ